jgi:hypothetical protein
MKKRILLALIVMGILILPMMMMNVKAFETVDFPDGTHDGIVLYSSTGSITDPNEYIENNSHIDLALGEDIDTVNLFVGTPFAELTWDFEMYINVTGVESYSFDYSLSSSMWFGPNPYNNSQSQYRVKIHEMGLLLDTIGLVNIAIRCHGEYGSLVGYRDFYYVIDVGDASPVGWTNGTYDGIWLYGPGDSIYNVPNNLPDVSVTNYTMSYDSIIHSVSFSKHYPNVEWGWVFEIKIIIVGVENYTSSYYSMNGHYSPVSAYNASEKQSIIDSEDINLLLDTSGNLTLIIRLHSMHSESNYDGYKDYVYYIHVGDDPSPPPFVVSPQSYDIMPYMSVGSGILFILGPGIAAVYWRHGRDLRKSAIWCMVAVVAMLFFFSTLEYL